MLALLALLLVSPAGATDSSRVLSKHWSYQGNLPHCAVHVEKGVIEAYTGSRLPLNQLLAWYELAGLLHPAGLGVAVDNIGEALAVKGLAVRHQKLQSLDAVRSLLSNGYAVMAIVNPAYYWEPGNPMVDFYVDLRRRYGLPLANHIVWVTGVSDGAVFLNDSALQNGGALRVTNDVFDKAWAASSYSAIVVEKPLPDLDLDGDGVPNPDEDGDGFWPIAHNGTDCDDSRADIHPGAIELDDPVDHDCDGIPLPRSASNDRAFLASAGESAITECLGADPDFVSQTAFSPRVSVRVFAHFLAIYRIDVVGTKTYDCRLTLPHELSVRYEPFSCVVQGDGTSISASCDADAITEKAGAWRPR